uniref:Ovule protein n=1 Tax=Anisakis simplex TaxID=6269 RepID=A0A0M3JKV6_ANISI
LMCERLSIVLEAEWAQRKILRRCILYSKIKHITICISMENISRCSRAWLARIDPRISICMTIVLLIPQIHSNCHFEIHQCTPLTEPPLKTSLF